MVLIVRPYKHLVLYLLCLAALMPAVGATAQSNPGEKGSRPNILFILADDLGYGELGCYGQKRIKTPRLDQMAAEGIRFTQAYAGSAVCAPSRASLMTGLHTGHTLIRNNRKQVLEPQEKTVAEVLKEAGYRTALIGKWALGGPTTTGAPDKQGFDEYLGYMTHREAHDYTPDFLWENGKKLPLEPNTYTPDLFTSRTLEYLTRQDDRPFFLYLAFTTPHAHNALGSQTGNGMEVPSDAPYSDESWPQPQKNHAAMITRMDAHIGRILDALKEQGLEQNTVVFFSSDNGPHREGGAKPDFFEGNGPLRGIKRDLYEGGIRVPMIAWWPGTIQPAVSMKAWAFYDFLPTAAELAGTKPGEMIDGLSMAEVLKGQSGPEREYLYWELIDTSKLGSFQKFQQAVRMGDWKAIRRDKVELYNLSEDPGEEKDLAAEHPELVAKAEKLFRTARAVPEDEATSAAKQSQKPKKKNQSGGDQRSATRQNARNR